ncbi:hypothetical protein [Spiroplasma endosymbiont of Poecilobothrus nobilitatus]
MTYKDKEKLQAKFIDGFIKNEFYDVEWQHFLGHFLYRHLFSKSNWR